MLLPNQETLIFNQKKTGIIIIAAFSLVALRRDPNVMMYLIVVLISSIYYLENIQYERGY